MALPPRRAYAGMPVVDLALAATVVAGPMQIGDRIDDVVLPGGAEWLLF